MRRISWLVFASALVLTCASAQNTISHARTDAGAERVEITVTERIDQADPATYDVRALRDDLQRIVMHSAGGVVEGVLGSVPAKGAPYAGDEVTEFSQVLGDGTHIQRSDKATVYRDSQGRSRRETPGQITISDPVEGISYTLDPRTMTARKTTNWVAVYNPGTVQSHLAEGDANKTKLALQQAEKNLRDSTPEKARPAQGAGPAMSVTTGNLFYVNRSVSPSGSVPAFFYNSSSAEVANESLGQRNIEGVIAEGTRTTETIPVGAIGNDRPIITLNERWFSPELNTVVMTRRSDPRTGEEVFRLTNIRLGEPSLSLFQPAGYQVVESPGVPTPFGPRTGSTPAKAPPSPPAPARR